MKRAVDCDCWFTGLDGQRYADCSRGYRAARNAVKCDCWRNETPTTGAAEERSKGTYSGPRGVARISARHGR